MSFFAVLQSRSQISQNVHSNPTRSFVVRAPALINLPIPLPSIPLLTPVLSPVIAGSQPQAVTTATTVPSPTPTSGNGNGDSGNGNGGGESGDGGNGNGGDGGNGNGGGGENGNGGDGGNNGSDGGGDSGSGGGNGGNGGSGGDSNNGGGNNNEGTTDNNQPGGIGTSGGQVSGSAPTALQTGVPTSGGSNSNTSPGNFVNNNDGNHPVNAGNDPNEEDEQERSGGVAHTTRTHGPNNTNEASSPTGTVRFTAGASGSVGGPRSTNTPGTDAGIEHSGAHTSGISVGAIVGIVIALLAVLLALFVIIMRRRSKARRSERRHRWWFTQKRNSKTYDDEKADGAVATDNRRRSARSSFETTVDHSRTPRLTLSFDTPPMPPMAELRGSLVLVGLNSPDNTTNPTAEQTRFSVGTISSIGTDDQGQWLIVNRDNGSHPEVRTPMSVRPFSPTESFAFPKPPTDRSSRSSRPVSANTDHSRIKSAVFEVPPTPAIPSAVANPFNDPEPLMVNSPMLIVPPSGNPFVDPTPQPCSPSAVHPEFMEVELVKRPFIPTLEDEILVEIGDKVKIIDMFDDGWAMVEKNTSPIDIKGKGRAQDVKEPEKGLIPIDCFRDPGVDVTSFINTKRLSSYSQNTVYY